MTKYLRGRKAIKALEDAGYPLKDSERKELMLKDGDPYAGRAYQRTDRKTKELRWVITYPWLLANYFSL